MDVEPTVGARLAHFEVTADGQRFLVDRGAGASETPPLTLAVNWPAGFAER